MAIKQMRNEKIGKRKVRMCFPRKFVLLCSFLFSLCSFELWAQNEEILFIQRLTWTGDEYAQRYEVVIEAEGEGAYRELRREFTSELFIEVSLLPGKYRCLVIPLNFLNQPGKASEWRYIEVLAALNPVLDDRLPAFVSSGSALYEMRVSGKNLIPGAEIFLRGPGGEQLIPFKIQNGTDGTNVRLSFEKDQLFEGDYELIIINPGGLKTSKSGIPFPPPESARLADREKKVDIYLSAAWMPSFTIYDEKNFFGRNLSLAGTMARFGVVWPKWNFFNPGLELTADYSFFNGDGGQVHLWGFGLNLLALRWFSVDKAERVPMALSFRLGAGYSILFNANIGISFLLFVMEHWYLETGLDYAYWFSKPPASCFRPWLGMGFRK